MRRDVGPSVKLGRGKEMQRQKKKRGGKWGKNSRKSIRISGKKGVLGGLKFKDQGEGKDGRKAGKDIGQRGGATQDHMRETSFECCNTKGS